RGPGVRPPQRVGVGVCALPRAPAALDRLVAGAPGDLSGRHASQPPCVPQRVHPDEPQLVSTGGLPLRSLSPPDPLFSGGLPLRSLSPPDPLFSGGLPLRS